MSYDTFNTLGLTDLNTENVPLVTTASGTSMGALGTTTCKVTIGTRSFSQTFLVCTEQKRSLILGRDFTIKNYIGVSWTRQGTKRLTADEELLMEVEETPVGHALALTRAITIPPRTMAVCQVECDGNITGNMRVRPEEHLTHQYPNLWCSPVSYKASELHELNELNEHSMSEAAKHPEDSLRDSKSSEYSIPSSKSSEYSIPSGKSSEYSIKGRTSTTTTVSFPRKSNEHSIIPYFMVNLSSHEYLHLSKNDVVAFAEPEEETVQYIEVAEVDTTDNSPRNWIPRRKSLETLPKLPKSDFICSPAEVTEHRKVELKDKPISERTRRTFDELCEKYDAAFSKSSEDIGRTSLITMDIDTGDSPPVCQRPYTLPLKHYSWVQKEIETLERAGVIERSVSPWASPIVVVPKKSAPGEPPRRRLCVDFRKVNELQPEVKRADTKGKGCLSLHPLPKIDEIYARLQGAKIFSTLDLRSGYYHIALGKGSRAKTAFVTPFGKYEFKMVPFGLSQAPAFFQALISEVLNGLDFAIGYLDDIIIFSKSEEEHLGHLEQIFERLVQAGLKLKRSKCDFFKEHIQYLGHLISEDGIRPLPEKLESVKSMPAPRNPKEIKQFLGLAGYYRKFVPRFSDISRPLTKLTRKDTEFKWTSECEFAFKLLKEALMSQPILRYPDPAKPYTLYTDASKYAWAGVLTQAYTTVIEGKEVTANHPVAYVSGLFRGSQCNWAAMTKEAYAIYMSVKKLSFYLESAEITLRSDHLPLKKFLRKNTLNSKVNNWAVELETYNIDFQHIDGASNTLPDVLSRLIQMNPDVAPEPEKEGYEFGYAAFEPLPSVPVEEILCEEVTVKPDPDDPAALGNPLLEFQMPLTPSDVRKFQMSDSKTRSLIQHVEGNTHDKKLYKLDQHNVLRRIVREKDRIFDPVVVPECLVDPILILAHDESGHNGYQRTYAAIKQLYYWKGMKRRINLHCKQCNVCAKHVLQRVNFEKTHFTPGQQPMEFISMDLIGEFYPASSKGNRYALTVICMLTGYTFCIPIPNKRQETVLKAYMDHVYYKFGTSRKILSDNGTEFKNGLFEAVAKEIGVEYKAYTPPYRPQSNGRIEGFHRFLKACIGKHISGSTEWDDVAPLATAAYNFFPNEHSRESAFFLMFGRDPLIPLQRLIQPAPKYLGTDENVPNLDALKNVYQMVAQQLEFARTRRDPKKPFKHDHKLQEGDLVLVRNHTSKAFQPKYKEDYRVVKFLGKNQVEIKDNHGKISKVHITDLKKAYMTDIVADQLPDYTKFGRASKLRLDPAKVEDLKWELSDQLNTQKPREEVNELTDNPYRTTTPWSWSSVAHRMLKLCLTFIVFIVFHRITQIFDVASA